MYVCVMDRQCKKLLRAKVKDNDFKATELVGRRDTLGVVEPTVRRSPARVRSGDFVRQSFHHPQAKYGTDPPTLRPMEPLRCPHRGQLGLRLVGWIDACGVRYKLETQTADFR